jgi:hypothetical protein
MEAECNVLSITMRELFPFKELVLAIGSLVGFEDDEMTTIRTTVNEDNVGALTLANLEPGRGTPRSKHYAIKMHWFRSKLKPNKVQIEYVQSSENQADIMTKGLKSELYIRGRLKLSGW